MMKTNSPLGDLTDYKIYSKFSKFYNALDSLKEIGVYYEIPNPIINVIGSPCSGKSSIIESLIGFDIIPKSSINQTKIICPIEINTVHLSKSSDRDYVVFDDDKDKKYYDFDHAKEKLNILLNSKEGKLSEVPIRLSIHSYYAIDVKVVNLPGLSKRSPSGQDIEKLTKEICNRYVRRDNSVNIIALSANEDYNQNLAFIYSNEFESLKKNFYYVFTKIDLCDKSLLEEIKKLISNISKSKENTENSDIKSGFNPHNGIVLLKNRSETQIVSNENIKLTLRKEKDFFRNILQFRQFELNNYFGYDTLADKIKKNLYLSISKSIPKIYDENKKRISECQEEIQKFGTDYIYLSNDTDSSKISFLNTLVSQFADEIDCIFSGKLSKTKLNNNLTNSSLKKIYYEFLEDYKNNQSSNLPSKSLTNEEIIHIIKVNEGDALSGFPESEVIHSVIEKEIVKLRTKVKEFSEEVINVIISCIKTCIDTQFCRFPPLIERIEEIINGFLEANFSKYRHLIDNISEMHFNYFYLDEKSLSYTNLLEKILSADNNVGEGEKQNIELDFNRNYYNKLVEYIKFLANYYHSLIIRDLREQIPKVTGEYLIKPIKQNLRFHLMAELKVSESAPELLKENPEIKKKREYYINSMKHLKEADKNLNLDDELKKLLKTEHSYKKSEKDNHNDDDNNGDNNYFKDERHKYTESEAKKNYAKSDYLHTKNINEEENKNYVPSINNQTHMKTNQNVPYSNQMQNNSFQYDEEIKNRENRKPNIPQNQQASQTKINNNVNSNNANYVNVNTNLNNQTYANNINVNTSNIPQSENTNSNIRNATNINFKYDPMTNQVKDVNVKVDMDAETAYKIYQDNKKYLPTTQQVISGAKTTANFVQNTGILNDIGNNFNNQNQASQPKKKAGGDPLSNFFGSGLNKIPNTASNDPRNTQTDKKGKF